MGLYEQLIKKHGTYQEFSKAVWDNVGMITVPEAQEACRKYMEELNNACVQDTLPSSTVFSDDRKMYQSKEPPNDKEQGLEAGDGQP